MWLPVAADLVRTHRVIAPDRPGLGASTVAGGPPDAARVLAWLGALTERTCPEPPAIVGASLGASIAARFAIAHPDRLSRLVLVDAGSLARFRPAPGVVLALVRFLARPSERTQRGFLRQVAVDPARAGALMGSDAQAYGLELGRPPRAGGRPPPPAPPARSGPARRAGGPPTAGCCASSGPGRSPPGSSPPSPCPPP